MVKVLFLCHGNICRSPMAQYVFKSYVKARGLESSFLIDSAAVSLEEIGNPIHCGTKGIFDKYGISFDNHKAQIITPDMFDSFDYIIVMDKSNVSRLLRLIPNADRNKIFLFLDFSEASRDIADPWYTGNFEDTYSDIKKASESFFEFLRKEGKI